MAAQQQQQQILAAAQLNQAATFQAAQLQAQIQAQARAASFQSLQQAAQMQSSAQNAAAAAMAASAMAADQLSEQMIVKSESDQQQQQQQQQMQQQMAAVAAAAAAATTPLSSSMGSDEVKLNIGEFQLVTEHGASSIMENNLITSSTTELNHIFEESAVNTTTVTSEPSLEINFATDNESESVANDVSSSNVIKQQAPRIIYNSPAVMASIVTSPVTKP